MAWVYTVPGQAPMVDLTVANDHTFAVGPDQTVVHNDGGVNPCDLPVLPVNQAASALNEGETNVRVATSADAEDLFLRSYVGGSGEGYTNTTGLFDNWQDQLIREPEWDPRFGGETMGPSQLAKRWVASWRPTAGEGPWQQVGGSYHWDVNWDPDNAGHLMWHNRNDFDSLMQHLQIHLPGGGAIRIFFGG